MGQLGDGQNVSHFTPTRVAGEIRFVSLAAGAQHTCGLTAEGQAYCWGSNLHRELGFDTPPTCGAPDDYYYYNYNYTYQPCALTPQPMSTTRFVAISVGYGTCGLEASGVVDCFGFAPSVASVSNGVRFARLDPDGRCGLSVDGFAYCWATDNQLVPPVTALNSSAFRSIAVGPAHSCGILARDGSAVCWGRNDVGQLGNGTTLSSSIPLPVARPTNP
jgi:alpha-tubulin suppressor-like RCC1 family protein